MHSAELIAVAALRRYTDRRQLGVRISMVSTQQVLSVESRMRVQQTSTDENVLKKSEEGEGSPEGTRRSVRMLRRRPMDVISYTLRCTCIAIACPCNVYITELELEVTYGRVYRASQGFDNRHQRAYSFLPAVIRGPET